MSRSHSRTQHDDCVSDKLVLDSIVQVVPSCMYVYILASKSRHSTSASRTTSSAECFEHLSGMVTHTAHYRINRLVYFEQHDTPMAAIEREKRIKSTSAIKEDRAHRNGQPCLGRPRVPTGSSDRTRANGVTQKQVLRSLRSHQDEHCGDSSGIATLPRAHIHPDSLRPPADESSTARRHDPAAIPRNSSTEFQPCFSRNASSPALSRLMTFGPIA